VTHHHVPQHQHSITLKISFQLPVHLSIILPLLEPPIPPLIHAIPLRVPHAPHVFLRQWIAIPSFILTTIPISITTAVLPGIRVVVVITPVAVVIIIPVVLPVIVLFKSIVAAKGAAVVVVRIL